MSEEIKNEVMETSGEINDIDDFNYSENECGSGKTVGLTIGLITGAVALGAAAYKKYKSKKKDGEQPKKKVKKRLRWVEVEDDVDNTIIDSTAEEIDAEEAEK